MRYDDWKIVFMEQRAEGTFRVWPEPFVNLRVPKIFNLRTDPYERADITSNTCYDRILDHAFLLVPAQAYVGQFLSSFKDYPQRQRSRVGAAKRTLNSPLRPTTAGRRAEPADAQPTYPGHVGPRLTPATFDPSSAIHPRRI